ncbi:uncharacterized protein ARMOST_15570 [Armillaria ostoyae]|uniref:Uncharacterized protein n=1 Tax=Armillaria ostoyae TaxID=47428 RepID=A0A284RTP6_ARMOS|nr:uncharacterized protein ARMOST_15570 [Armillaria ostoyae]
MDDNELDSALVTVRSHLVEVLKPSDSPRTQKHKKAVAASVKQTLYDLVKMVEDEEDDEEEDEDEPPGNFTDRTHFFSPRVFHLTMSNPVQTGAAAENKALLRLLHGYAGEQDHWASVLHAPLKDLQDWDSWCEQSKANDAQEVFEDQLLFFPKMVHAFGSELDATSFLQYVLRMIEALKFIERWNSDEWRDGQSPRTWKIKHVEHAFKYSSSANNDLWQRLHHLPKQIAARQPLNKAMKKHSSEHARMITSRNTFYDLYKLFGPTVFLDRLWDPQYPKSKSFRALLGYLTDNMPQDETAYPINVTRFSRGADSLYNILSILTSNAVAKYAQKFMQEHEPRGQEGTRSWGRAPEGAKELGKKFSDDM